MLLEPKRRKTQILHGLRMEGRGMGPPSATWTEDLDQGQPEASKASLKQALEATGAGRCPRCHPSAEGFADPLGRKMGKSRSAPFPSNALTSHSGATPASLAAA